MNRLRTVLLVPFILLAFNCWPLESFGVGPGDKRTEERDAPSPKRLHSARIDDTAASALLDKADPADHSPGSKSSKGSGNSYVNPERPYAKPTNDIAFKHMLSLSTGSDPLIIISLLNTFVPAFRGDPVVSVQEQPVSLPGLKRRSQELQTFMDVHVVSQRGIHYIIEMQARRHAMFDERVLYYACRTYGDQLGEEALKEGNWYRLLNPVIALQFVDYNTNKARGIGQSDEERALDKPFLERVRTHPLPDGSYLKRYVLTDKRSGQEIDHLQIVQVELPRVEQTRKLFPPQEDFTAAEWWVSLFRHGNEYTNEMRETWQEKMPKEIQKALKRLDLTEWAPRMQREYRLTSDDMEQFTDVILAERCEAREEGRKEGRASVKRAVALRMLAKKQPIRFIAEITGLEESVIKGLEAEQSTDSPK